MKPTLRYLKRLLKLKGLILAASIVSVAVAHVSLARWYEKFGHQPGDVYPDFWLYVPYVLLFSSVMLMIGRWWAYLLALMISSWLIYFLGYMALLGVANAHDWSLLSIAALRYWFVSKYGWQPQELFQFALGVVILVYSSISLVAAAHRDAYKERPASNKRLSGLAGE